MKQIIDLNGKWDLYLAPHNQVKGSDIHYNEAINPKNLPTNINFINITAEVPGNFELDMQKAGLLPDLYMGTNTLLCQKYENQHLWYVKEFTLDQIPNNDIFLRFEGIDTFADIYLNNEFIYYCDNMLIPHEICVNEHIKKGVNKIIVHIHPTTI